MLVLLFAALGLEGCCSALDVREFERLSLEEKLQTYERAVREGCVRGAKLALLAEIADHGKPAADAMLPRVNNPSSSFPSLDAIDVIRFVHFKGVDLRTHEAVNVLDRLAQSAADPEVRTEAAKARSQIMTNTPPPPPRPFGALEHGGAGAGSE